jgi:WD40 repeat protein
MRNFLTNLLILISLNIFSQSINDIKDFDGNSYKTENLGGILISTSTLNVTHFNNGDKIFEVNSIKTLNEATKNKIPAYCHFKFDKSKTTLYNWYAVNDKRGLLPKGYVLPSEELISKLYYNFKEKPNTNVFSKPVDGIIDTYTPNIFLEHANIYWSSDNCDKVNSLTARHYDNSFLSMCTLKNNFLPLKFVKLSDVVNTPSKSNDYKVSKNVLSGHNASVTSVKFSKSGKYVASGEGGEEVISKSIKIWDVSSGNCIQTINGGGGDIQSIDFSPDESRIVTGSTDKSIKIWNVSDGRLIQQFQILHSSYISSVKFNNSGDKIVSSGSYDGTVIIWNANTGASLYKIKVSNKKISEAVFSPDGKYVVCGNNDSGEKKIFVYNASNGTLLKSINNNDDYVNTINFSVDGKKLITACYKVNLFDFMTGNLLSSAESLGSFGGSYVKFGENDNLIEKSRGTLVIRDIAKSKILKTINAESNRISSFDVTSDGKLAVVGTDEKEVKFFKLEANVVKSNPTVGISDFGISKITFEYTGNIKNKKLTQLTINKKKIISSIGYAYSNFVNDVDLDNTEIVKKEEIRMMGLLSKKLNIEKQQILSIFFDDPSYNNKSIVEIYRILLDSFFKGNDNLKNTTMFTSLPLKIEAYENVSEEEKKQDLIARQKAEEIKDNKNKGIQNFCFTTYEGKYKISLFNDGSYNASYKLFSSTGQLKKTVSAKWSIKDEGVYGSAYILYVNFTGANASLGSMKFTCQYDAGWSLQAIIDNRDRTWNACD